MNAWPFPSAAEQVAIKPAPPRPGTGTRLTANDLGSATSFHPAAKGWAHPFRATLSGRNVRFRRGTIDTREPRIGDLPMSSAALQLQGRLNSRSESFIVAEIYLDPRRSDEKQGRLNAETKIIIAERAEWKSYDPWIARTPIAMVLWRGGTPSELHQIARLDMLYQRVDGAGGVVHLFR